MIHTEHTSTHCAKHVEFLIVKPSGTYEYCNHCALNGRSLHQMHVECSDSSCGQFTTDEIVPGACWVEGWVGPSCDLSTVTRRNTRTFPEMEQNGGRHIDR
jgi:hypothetical protein